MAARVALGILAALRAVLVYGEVSTAESWQPRLPRLRLPLAPSRPRPAVARGSGD